MMEEKNNLPSDVYDFPFQPNEHRNRNTQFVQQNTKL